MSDNKSLCASLFLLAEMLGAQVQGYGVHGCVPYIVIDNGRGVGYIYEFEYKDKVFYQAEGWDPSKMYAISTQCVDGNNYRLEV